MPVLSIRAYQSERDALLQRITSILQDDSRVAAAWLTGSFGRGEDDAWSDFDLHVAVHDAHFLGFIAELDRLYQRVGRPILVQGFMNSNAQPGGRFQLVLYEGPLEVDWNIGPLSLAWRPRTSVMLFDRAEIPLFAAAPLSEGERHEVLQSNLIFFWAMAPIGIKYVARGATSRAVGNISLLHAGYLALRRLLEDPPADPRLTGTNIPAPADMPRLGREIDPRACLDVMLRLFAEVESMHSALSDLGVNVPTEVPPAVRRLAQLIP